MLWGWLWSVVALVGFFVGLMLVGLAKVDWSLMAYLHDGVPR
jgi:hypothetical protein